jgi:hypothetical protein
MWSIAIGKPLSVDRSGDDEIDAPRASGQVGISEAIHPDERGLAVPPRWP